jgi:hypothetical protein
MITRNINQQTNNTMNKTPVIIQSEVSNRRKITIIVKNGNVENIVKERCSDINVELNNYDIDKGPEYDNIFTDLRGKQFLKTTFN